MHQPRPYGYFGPQLDALNSGAVDALAKRVTNLKHLYGVESFRLTRTLPDGSMAVVQDMGGVFKAIVLPQYEQESIELPHDGVATSFIPMLFSGRVLTPDVRHGQGVSLAISKQTRARLAKYPTGEDAAKKIEAIAQELHLRRFVIEPHGKYPELRWKFQGSAFINTQYKTVYPTWFSGAMAQMVQIVAGYGRGASDFAEGEVGQEQGSAELAQLTPPKKVLDQIEQEAINVRLPGYTGVPPADGQLRASYSFRETDGVSFDTSGKPWLVRINNRGVYAMPLPLVPATTTEAFSRWIEEVQDDEIALILETFKGMPSGEVFPESSEDWAAWERAGVIIKLCDSADFYEHMAYSSACGWSFNLSGGEAYNTCLDYDQDKGLAYGLTYKLSLRLQPAAFDGKLPPLEMSDTKILEGLGVTQDSMNDYLSGLYRLAKANTGKHLAIKYKLRAAGTTAISERAKWMSYQAHPDFESELAYWDKKVMPAIASHSAQLACVNKGWLLNCGVKFPEPALPEYGLVTVLDDAMPHWDGKEEKRDTIVFAYHVGNDLKVVKHFYDPRSFAKQTEGNFEENMYVGSWEKTEYIGAARLSGNTYTTDIDERDTVAPKEIHTTIVGKDKGYGFPYHSFGAFFSMEAIITRRRYYSHDKKVATNNNRQINGNVSIPYFCRNALVYTGSNTVDSGTVDFSSKMYSLADPYSYGAWTFDAGGHFIGGDSRIPHIGQPYPARGIPVWATVEFVDPALIGDFADTGPWINPVDDVTHLIHPNGPDTHLHLSGGGDPPPFMEYSYTQKSDRTSKQTFLFSVLPPAPVKVNGSFSQGYMQRSPTPDGLVYFYVDACAICFGKMQYANLEEYNQEGRRQHWGYTKFANHLRMHYFIGVINE